MPVGIPLLSLAPERGLVQIHMVWSPSEATYMQAYITMHFSGSTPDDMCRICGTLPNFHKILCIHHFGDHFEYIKVTEFIKMTYFKKHIVLPLQRKNRIKKPNLVKTLSTFTQNLFSCLPNMHFPFNSSEGVNQ